MGAQLDQLERMVHDIEFATVQKQVIDGLKNGNEALEKANAMFSIDEIEDILADTKQAEINAMLSGHLTEEDENEVVNELDKLLEALEPSIVSELPTVPTDKIQEDVNIDQLLPEVPAKEPKQSKSKTPVAVAAS